MAAQGRLECNSHWQSGVQIASGTRVWITFETHCGHASDDMAIILANHNRERLFTVSNPKIGKVTFGESDLLGAS